MSVSYHLSVRQVPSFGNNILIFLFQQKQMGKGGLLKSIFQSKHNSFQISFTATLFHSGKF